MAKQRVKPRCPYCSSGPLRLQSEKIDDYYRLFYCQGCGAIHGVVPDLIPEPSSFFEAVELEIEAASDTPHCPQHNLRLEKITVPPGYKESGQVYWVCPKSNECHYHLPAEVNSDAPSQPRTSLSIFRAKKAIISLVNQAGERKMTPDRIGAMVKGSGGLYSEIMTAPLCPTHTIPMELITVPELYKEAGSKLWVCPQYAACEYWEDRRHK